MHRIKRKGGLAATRAQPVFFMHGLAMSGGDFLRRVTEDALREFLDYQFEFPEFNFL